MVVGPRDPHGQAGVPHRWELGPSSGSGPGFLGVAWGRLRIEETGDDLFLKYPPCRNNLYLTRRKKDCNQRKHVWGKGWTEWTKLNGGFDCLQCHDT